MLLKVGSKGDDVKQLQSKLGLGADGSFGFGTEAAVKQWQHDNGLTPDGIVGDKTWGLIMGEGTISSPTVITEPSPIKSVGGLKLENLRGHIPDSVIAQIPDTAAKFEINTPLRLAHFLAQCGHESGGFKLTKENLNYSAKGLNGIFKKYFPTLESALLYERKPEKIANKVYGGRMGNGDETTGDGSKYCGRGYLQSTGKENYTKFSKFIGEDCVNNPDLVATKYPLASAGFFFLSNKLLLICDKGNDRQTVEAVTRKVNGGLIGIEERWLNFQKIYSLLS
jgi:putative chitinase